MLSTTLIRGFDLVGSLVFFGSCLAYGRRNLHGILVGNYLAVHLVFFFTHRPRVEGNELQYKSFNCLYMDYSNVRCITGGGGGAQVAVL